jgi:hypothetical protein
MAKDIHSKPESPENCPHCGRPGGTVTIQKTRKSIKIQFLISTLMFWWGVMFLALNGIQQSPDPASTRTNMIIAVLGFCWYCVAMLQAWWHHR